MNFRNYIIKSLKYYRSHHLGLILATVLSSAILTGALLVGDSVKYSLRKNVDQRLGKIGFALESNDRFVRSLLANEIRDQIKTPTSAILKLSGIAVHPQNKIRHNNIQVYGVDQSFWELSEIKPPELGNREVVLSESLSRELQVKRGDHIILKIQKNGIIPLNAPFNSNDESAVSLRVKVVDFVNHDQLGGFSLKNEQTEVFNAFINQDFLSSALDLNGLCNLIIVRDTSQLNSERINQALGDSFKLKDASININFVEDSGSLQLTSERVFIDYSIGAKVESLKLRKKSALTYFVNSLSHHQKSTPYSFVSAINPAEFELKSNEILINSWLAEDLNAKTGDSLKLKYYIIGPLRKLDEKTETFIVKEVIDIQSPLFSKSLMPHFPGLSTAGNCSDWDAGIPIDLKKIRNKDEAYWDDYQGTPKAFIQMKKANEIWNNPFGNFTAFYFNPDKISKDVLTKKLLSVIGPQDLGFFFRDVRKEGNRAANNGVDFGQLFLSLSFFIILSAIILLVLIFQLHQKLRLEETGLLIASGFSRKKIIILRVFESLPVIISGSILGSILGIIYNQVMIWGLNHVWNQAVHTNKLEAFIIPTSITYGFLISIIISFLSIFIVLRNQLKRASISSIRGQSSISFNRSKIHFWFAVGFLVISFSLISFSIFNSIEKSSSLMLASGFLILLSLVFFISSYWDRMNTRNNYLNNLFNLSLVNARRNKKRSLAVIVLLAIGTFTILVTGANRKTFNESEDQRNSGTGGFTFWADNSIPISQNLNTKEGKKEYGLESDPVLESCQFIQFKSVSGDDASCLNLNQVKQPQLLGVNPLLFDSLGAFSFAKTIENTDHPWLLLEDTLGRNIIPAIADQTVIQWGLIKKIGDTLNYVNENGGVVKMVLVGGLNASIFQGNLLISEEHFMKFYPSSAGSKHMLIDCPLEVKSEVKRILTNQLTDYGIELTDNQQRLSSFYSVTNTYLNIFMILGGLGVLIGTLGLGLILYRNILERKDELVLMRAIGFSKAAIRNNIFIENIILVSLGILFGVISAIVGILPSFLTSAFDISGTFMIYLVVIIFISSVFWILLSVKSVLKHIGI